MSQHLATVLECLTEGSRAPAFSRLTRRTAVGAAFATEADVVAARERPWVLGSGIQGVGIGEKVTAGQCTGVLALRVYVEHKRPEAGLANRVPKTVAVADLAPVVTDVLEIGRLQVELFRDRVRPVMPGCGIGLSSTKAGTLGAFVRRAGEDDLFILSNSHVIADYGLAAIDDPILQPGASDDGTATDKVGTLADVVPFEYTDSGFPNLVDAAIGRIKPQLTQRAFRLLGRQPVGITTNLRRGMRVHKVGRTSDLTTGIVQDVNFRLSISYKKSATQTSRVGFREQVLCTRFTQPGDSGSLVLSTSNRAVGLHFAGSTSASVFNRIRNVLTALRVELVVED